MKNGEPNAPATIEGWPEHHFANHRKRHAEFDPAAQRALLAVRSTAQVVENAVGTWFFGAGLTAQKFGVLLLLDAEPKPISLSDLRRYLGTTQANVTGLVAGLERDGFIERHASTRDRRVSYVNLARGGKRALASMLPQYFARTKAALRSLNQAEKKTLLALLSKVSRGFAAEETR